jgi:urea transport system ATP-binding protein
VLEVRGLRAGYGRVPILQGIDLTLAESEAVGILGHNGMGKTTLVKALIGILRPTAGRIVFQGQDITAAAPFERVRRGLGYVPQGREIFPQLTVEENLQVGLGIRKLPAVPPRIYKLFPVLKDMKLRRGGDLSGGQQQQLAIGRALVLQPTLLILDEPTEGIQPNVVHEIGSVLLRLNKEEGLTILLVEQKLPFARRVASDFTVLEKGRVVASGPIESLTDEVVKSHLTV